MFIYYRTGDNEWSDAFNAYMDVDGDVATTDDR